MSAGQPPGGPGGEQSQQQTVAGFKLKAAKTAARGRPTGPVHEQEPEQKRQQITGFSGGKAQTLEADDEANRTRAYVVPKLENTFKPGIGKKFTPSFKPPERDAPVAGDDRFELATEDSRPAITSYGLETRRKPADEQNGDAKQEPKLSTEQLELLAYKHDMETLPDIPDEEAYESMPIEEFGLAMLRGMGWKEGMAVGKDAAKRKEVAKPVEYLRRPERLGLGAQHAPPATDNNKKKIVKMGDKPTVRREDMVLAPDADGRIRHVRNLDEKLVHRSELQPGPRPGKTMKVSGGRHAGLRCEVLDILPSEPDRSDRAKVRLLPSHEVVDVRMKDLEDLGPVLQQNTSSSGRRDAKQENGHSHDADVDKRDSKRRRSVGGDDGDDDLPVDKRDRNGHRKDSERDRHREYDDERRDRGSSRRPEAEGRFRDAQDTRNRVDDRHGCDDYRSSRNGEGSRYDGHNGHHTKAGRSRSRSDSDSEYEQQRGPVWLVPYIKALYTKRRCQLDVFGSCAIQVRVIDKRVKGGELYLKKGTIVDVHPGGLCDLVLDDNRKTVQLKQNQLETVVPKEIGAAVMVVAGQFKGNKARLHAKSSDGEACAVQLVTDFTIQRLLLEQVATYVGSLDDD